MHMISCVDVDHLFVLLGDKEGSEGPLEDSMSVIYLRDERKIRMILASRRCSIARRYQRDENGPHWAAFKKEG